MVADCGRGNSLSTPLKRSRGGTADAHGSGPCGETRGGSNPLVSTLPGHRRGTRRELQVGGGGIVLTGLQPFGFRSRGVPGLSARAVKSRASALMFLARNRGIVLPRYLGLGALFRTGRMDCGGLPACHRCVGAAACGPWCEKKCGHAPFSAARSKLRTPQSGGKPPQSTNASARSKFLF